MSIMTCRKNTVLWLGLAWQKPRQGIQERCRGSQILRGSSQPALAPGEYRWRLRRRAERLDADAPAQYACGGRESSQGNRPRRVHAECVFGNCGGLRETRPARDGGKNATPTYLFWRMASSAVRSARTRCSPTYTVKKLSALTTRRHSLRLPSCSQWTLMPLNRLGSCHVR